MSEPIYRIKLFEDVANHIIDRIQSEQYTAGERIPPEDQLAQEFDVSRSTVRQAIHSLQVAGILRSRAGSGTFVSEAAPFLLGTRELAGIMSRPERLRELVQARYLLEPPLAAMAAQQATEDERAALLAIMDKMEKQTDRLGLMTVGHAFHLELAHMAHNCVLNGFYQSVANQLKAVRSLDFLTLETYLEGAQEHRLIAQAVVAGDADAARRHMQAHLRKDYRHYLDE